MAIQLQVTALQKNFNHHAVLQGVSLTAHQGDIIVLLGKSGSGKSTLLRCLNLLEQPDGGSIRVNNLSFDFAATQQISTQQKRQLRQQVGMVFQQFNLWPHLTVLENLITAPQVVLKHPKSETIAQAQGLLDKVGIADKARCYPAQLSGGQQQRVAIARALMMQPQLMLFDEPTSALDPQMTYEVLKVMKALAQEGKTMVVATHVIGFAREVASHVLFLEQGRIVEEGSVQETIEHPKTVALQKFLERVK